MTQLLAAGHKRDDVDLSRDRALVERWQAGDESAFDDLYLRYYARLCRFCFQRLGDRDEAEDTAQEAFARAWKAMPSFEGDRRFYPWLSVIASNLCVDSVRRSSKTTALADEKLDVALGPVEGGQEALVERQNDNQVLAMAMGRLQPRQREVLELRELQEWSYQRIAEHQGVGVGAIETLLFRARRNLRRQFATVAEGTGALTAVEAVRRLLWRIRLKAFHVSSYLGGARSGASTGASSTSAAGAAPVAARLLAVALVAGGVAAATLASHPTPAARPATAHHAAISAARRPPAVATVRPALDRVAPSTTLRRPVVAAPRTHTAPASPSAVRPATPAAAPASTTGLLPTVLKNVVAGTVATVRAVTTPLLAVVGDVARPVVGLLKGLLGSGRGNTTGRSTAGGGAGSGLLGSLGL